MHVEARAKISSGGLEQRSGKENMQRARWAKKKACKEGSVRGERSKQANMPIHLPVSTAHKGIFV